MYDIKKYELLETIIFFEFKNTISSFYANRYMIATVNNKAIFLHF